MKSLKTKISLIIVGVIVVICSGLLTAAYFSSSSALEGSTNESLVVITDQVEKVLNKELTGDLAELSAIASNDIITDPDATFDEKMAVIQREVKRIGAVRMGISDLTGNLRNHDGTSAEVSQREYFLNAKAGGTGISDPIISKADGALVIMYAVPIMNDGKVIGVLTEARDGNNLSAILSEIEFGETGTAFMLNKEGTIIASDNEQDVKEMRNIIKEQTEKSASSDLAALHSAMIAGNSGTATYKEDGHTYYAGYSPIEGTSWSLAVGIQKNEALSSATDLAVFQGAILVAAIVIASIAGYFMARFIVRKISHSGNYLTQISEGVLNFEFNEKDLNSKDEIGDMVRSLNQTRNALKETITGIRENSVKVDGSSRVLSETSRDITVMSQNVTETIAEIAKGTTLQSEELTNVSIIVNDFGQRLENVVSNVSEVENHTKVINSMANRSTEEMNQLNESVIKVGDVFQEFNQKIQTLTRRIETVNEITSLINEVSAQTNLLALNASIEAARAGDAGRGFAVVATEIGNLAEQSRSSSEEITKLITGVSKETEAISQSAIEMNQELEGQMAVIKTAIGSFSEIITMVEEVLPNIQGVKKAVGVVQNDKNDILNRVGDITAVSEEISASTEEIATSAKNMNQSMEEVAQHAIALADQAKDMLDGVESFKI